jgi:hypothetical protein
MRRHSLAGGLLTASLASVLLLAGTASASAQKTEQAPVQLVTSSTNVKSPVLFRPRARCSDEGAVVTVKLRNPTKTVRFFEVRLSGGAVAEALPVMLTARGVDSVEFHGIPDGRYLVVVLNDLGDYVADTRIRVRCKVKPPALPSQREQAHDAS